MSEFDDQCARILSSGQGYYARDSRVIEIAREGVDEAFDLAGRRDNPVATLSREDRELRDRLVQRATAAIEQAIEHELGAILAELTA